MSRWLKGVLLSAAILGLLATSSVLAQDNGWRHFRSGTAEFGQTVDLRPVGRVPGQYIVVFRDGVRDSRATARNMSRRERFSLRRTFSHALKGFSGRMSARTADRLRFDPDVAFVEQDVYAHTAAQALSTGVDRIDADLNSIAAIGTMVSNVDVDVAIIDTGVSPHSDLNLVGQVNFTNEGSLSDLNGHGTHVAGIVAAIDNGIGVVGVAPGARIHSVKVLDSNGSGFFSDVIEGIDWVTANALEIEVANMSLSGVGYSAALRQAIQNSVAAGVVYVVAAANSSQDVYGANGKLETSQPSRWCRWYGNCADDYIPASYPEVATISALADSDGQEGGGGGNTSYGADDTLASFSNYSGNVVGNNPVLSPGLAIDLAAPGVNIASTWKGNGYNTISGTSMASPHVAGAVALYIADPANGRANDAAGVYAIRQALIDAAQPQSAWRGGAPTNDPDGNAEGLVYVADGGVAPPEPEPNTAPEVSITSPGGGASFVAGDPISFEGSADDAQEGSLTAILDWTSSLDGPIGGGGSFSDATLREGQHIIMAEVMDSGGLSGDATVSITIEPPPAVAPPSEQSLSVESIGYRTTARWWRTDLYVTVALMDDGGGAVSDASLSIEVSRDGGLIASGTGTTGDGGTVTFRLRRARSGLYTTEVTDVSADGLAWDGATPPNDFDM